MNSVLAGDRAAAGWVAARRTARSLTLGMLLVALFGRSACADEPTDGANHSYPDEITLFAERVYSLDEWPPSSGYGIEYRKIITSYLAASLGYLNDAHFPGHHRDGVTAEAWVPILPFSSPVTLSAGVGPFYYYDTVFARNSAGYADAHGWAWLGSVEGTWSPWQSGIWSHFFFEARIDYSAPSRSIRTTSIGLGLGWRDLSDIHQPDPGVAAGFAPHEIVGSAWKTVTNSYDSENHTAPAEAIDFRWQVWKEIRASVGVLNEGDTKLIRRNGAIAEAWAEPSFDAGRWSIGAGFGFYSAIDKYRPSPGRHVSDVVSLTASVRLLDNFDARVLWHRIVTDYNRDTDVILWGAGYRF